MAQVQIVYWRDIPAQVIAQKSRREQIKKILTDRFAEAIDRAAMRGGDAGTDDYLAQWRKSDPQTCSDDLQQEADRLAAQLEQDYDNQRLSALVKAGGVEISDN